MREEWKEGEGGERARERGWERRCIQHMSLYNAASHLSQQQDKWMRKKPLKTYMKAIEGSKIVLYL